uniref:Zinc finger protein on ecdysone puffs n=3 Tax=Bactrocera latifrons TaxID=174628 RepID=A0A0K8V2V2_BACLA
MKKFLMPYCSTCHLAFKSPMLYETHRCSLEHLKRKARKRDSDSDNSDEDTREIDLNKFLTVDSVGEIDEIDDMDVDALLNEGEGGTDGEENSKERQPVGGSFIKKVDAYFCELCNHYSVASDSVESYAKKHCLLRSHLKAYLRNKEEEEKAAKKAKVKEEKEEIENDKRDSVKKENDAEQEEDKDAAEGNGHESGGEEVEEVGEDKLWEDVDKDLGDLLREVGPEDRDDEEEDESVLNIDIESEKPKVKEINGKKEEPAAAQQTVKPAPPEVKEVKEVKAEAKIQTTPAKPKPQRKVASATKTSASSEAKEKSAAAK